MYYYIALHIVCAILSYGLALAHFQRKYPTLAKADYENDVTFALTFSVMGGPFALVIAALMTRFKYGIMYRNPHLA